MIRDTTLEAYQFIEAEGKTKIQRERILELIKATANGLTRNEISRLLHLRINAVCGRCNWLLKKSLVYEDEVRLDQFTNKKNNVLKAR